MPKVELIFFASFKDLLDQDRIQVQAQTIREALEIAGVLDAVQRQTALFAVNQVITDMDHVLVDGDEVAVMPPMTGG